MEQQVIIQIKILTNTIKRTLQNSDCFCDCRGMTGMHGWIISYLCRNPDHDIFQKDIEAQLSIRRSTATGMLQLMEKNGLIIREPVPYDARLKKLVPTRKALDINRRIEEKFEQINTQLIHGLTREEVDLFCSVAEKMRNNLSGCET
ncbi:MAG: MarR family transcriptional regulator [Methanocorpusculum sp.]|nr:MarR family transcriptional regulator [Methanocorpusculum sp.]